MFKMLITLKKRLVFGVLDIEEIRDKDNAPGLKKGKVIKINTTFIRAPFAFVYFTYDLNRR